MPAFRVVCNGCGASGETDDGQNLDNAAVCAEDSGCCSDDHGPSGHAGDVCDRSVTIYASADLLATTQG
jgi:hypothetical protein